MKVFISWSGDSKGVAQAINRVLPQLFDTARPWISTENRSGSIWLNEIDQELSDTDFGIICLTKSNQHAPWINFEAGALSRRVESKRELMPILLVDFDDMSEVDSPVTGFQMKMATQEGFFDVMKDLNSCELGPKINPDILKTRVGLVWPEIEKEVNQVRSDASSTNIARRSVEDKVDELLDTVRGIAARLPSPKSQAVDKARRDILERMARGEGVSREPDTVGLVLADQAAVAVNDWANKEGLAPHEVSAHTTGPMRISVTTIREDPDRLKAIFSKAVDAAGDTIVVDITTPKDDGTVKISTFSKKAH